MAVAVDFDHRRELHAERLAFFRDSLRGFDAVEQYCYVCAFALERRHMIELVGGNTHRVENVGDPVRQEVLRLLQCRHRDAAALVDASGPTLQCAFDDVDRFRRLDVRPQRHAERGQVLAHPREIAIEQVTVEDQRRRFEIGEMHEVRIED
jgi:hypothetical protein